MKRLYLTIICALFIFSCPLSIAADWQAANQLYAEGNHADAAEQYEAILQENAQPEVYYNLGNAYFKQGEIARAILSY